MAILTLLQTEVRERYDKIERKVAKISENAYQSRAQIYKLHAEVMMLRSENSRLEAELLQEIAGIHEKTAKVGSLEAFKNYIEYERDEL